MLHLEHRKFEEKKKRDEKGKNKKIYIFELYKFYFSL